VSTFVTGVVRRGAGLPAPVAVLPTASPGPMANSSATEDLGRTVIENSGGVLEPRFVLSPAPVHSADHATRSLQPPSTMAPIPRLSEVRTEEVSKERRPERASTPPAAHVVRGRPVCPTWIRETPADVRLQPDSLAPPDTAKPIATQTKSQDIREVTSPSIRQSANSAHLGPPKPPQIEPTRQLQFDTKRPTPAAPEFTLGDSREPATRETHNIQVKIGKVEIRSTQPPPVVQAPRRNTASGFEDLKMARNYFSRGRG
jgi:hypothetical protein